MSGKAKEEEEDEPVGKGFSFAEPTFEAEGDEEEGDEQAPEEEGGEGEQQAEGEVEGEGEGEGAEEPEDDYNAAWEVLDVARTIYLKLLEDNKGEMREERMKLADTYLALGDVSCETGKSFPSCPHLLLHSQSRRDRADNQKTSRKQ